MIALRFTNAWHSFAQKSVNVLLRGCGLLVLTLMTMSAAHAAASCTVSATGSNFGPYDPLSLSPTVTTGSVTATCKWLSGSATTVNIVSSYSAGNSGNFSSRSMKSGTHVLSYNLYFDDTYTQIRGDGTGGSLTGSASMTVSRTSSPQMTSSPIYGRIPAGQDVAAGSYSDTIVVTLTY